MCGRYYIETEDTLSVQGAIRLAGFESGADCVNRPSNGFAVRRVRRYKSSICNRLVALCAPCVSSTCRQQAFVLRHSPRPRLHRAGVPGNGSIRFPPGWRCQPFCEARAAFNSPAGPKEFSGCGPRSGQGLTTKLYWA